MDYYSEFDALTEGVEPGGLRSKDEIKALICYLLKTVDAGLTRENLGNIMQDRGIANYFEAMDAVSDLISNGSIRCDLVDETEVLSVTDAGRSAVAVVENDLPKTVRESAVRSAIHFVTLERNARENDVRIEKTNDGYTITFALKDRDTVMMELSLFVGDRDQAEKIKNNFLEDPVKVYSGILASLIIE